MEDNVRMGDGTQGMDSQQGGVAGSCADKPDLTGVKRGWHDG